MISLIILFWTAVGLIIYTLAIYPLLALLLAKIVNKRVLKQAILPRVSFIISAYNEEAAIGNKVKKTLELDYPRDKMEIIVASDGSTDRTDEIVRSFADQGVKLFRTEGRLGKTGTMNAAVESATGDIIVFSDATGIFNKESIRHLVANFNDHSVGCVTGRVVYHYGKDTTSKGFKGYQRFAVSVRHAETFFGSQTSVSGSIHAIRRSLYRLIREDFTPDVINAVHAVVQGYRVVYEYGATSLEESRTCLSDEFHCRVRNAVLAIAMIPYIFGQLIRYRRWVYLFQVVSHKMLRWWLWLLLLIMFVTNMMLMQNGALYMGLGILQVLAYGLGCLGLLAEKSKLNIPGLSSLAFFLLGNAATCVGSFKALTGKRMARWEPVR